MNNETMGLIHCEAFSTADEEPTVFEEIFYINSAIFGFLFNMLVLFIAFRHVDTRDKPRQVGFLFAF